jgi:hypothetical protein
MEVNPTLWTPGSGCHVTRDVPLLRKADTVTLRDMDSVTRHARGHVRMSRTTSRALSSRWPGQFSRFVPHVPLSTAGGRALHFKDERTYSPWSLKTKATPVATPIKALDPKALNDIDAAIGESIAAALLRWAARGRDVHAALGDAIEVAAHHRVKFGRRVCTWSDGDIVRLEFEALRRMLSRSNTRRHPWFPS